MNHDQATTAAEVVAEHVDIGIVPEHDEIRPLLESAPDSLLLAVMLHLGHRIGTGDDSDRSTYERALQRAADAYEEVAELGDRQTSWTAD